MYNTNVSVCPQTIFNMKSVGENTWNGPNYLNTLPTDVCNSQRLTQEESQVCEFLEVHRYGRH